MAKLSVDLNEPKDSSKTDKAALNGRTRLDYGLHSLNVDADVLEMSKYVKDYKIILVYVEHRSSIVDISMFDSSSNVNRNVRKDFVARPIIVESVVDPLDGLDEILGANANTGKQITRDESTWKQMVVHVDPKHDTRIGVVDVQDDDLDVIDYDLFGSDLDDGIDSKRRIQPRIGQTKGSPAIRENINSSKQTILGKDKIVEGKGPWPGQILTAVEVGANNGIYLVAYAIVEAESKAYWCWFLNLLGEDLGIESNFNYTFIFDRYYVRHIHENMKSQFKGGVYKNMLWNAAKANSEGEFKRKMGRDKCDIVINNICEVFNRQLVDGRDQPIITCLEYIREYLMKRIVVCQKVIAKTVRRLTSSVKKCLMLSKRLFSTMFNGMEELTEIPCKHVLVAIYNMSKNSMGVGIPEQWVHAAYKLERWAHVYLFKVYPCNGKDIWPVVESRTVILLIQPLYKPLIGRPPKKRKKSNDEIASQSASSGKLSRKGKSVTCGKCGKMGHNRKYCRG
nr:hypothetical protein [Tanacetum cinerariifolium]